MPYAVLLHWLKLKHPRMVPDRLEELYRSLVRELETIGTDGASPLRRALALDFGDQQWTREGWQPGGVSTHGVAERGVQAVLHHVMDEASLPFLLDWAFEPPASPVLSRWLTHPNCRAVVLRQGRVPEPRGGALLIDGQDLGTVDVQLNRLVRFGLNLHLNQAGLTLLGNRLRPHRSTLKNCWRSLHAIPVGRFPQRHRKGWPGSV